PGPWTYDDYTGFQSAPACERATASGPAAARAVLVSIRARVRAGDKEVRAKVKSNGCFNPRPRASGRL
ncbi:MAG: hypothetical protein ACLQKK_21780, partial [Rhodomicrobium sp.]